MTYSDTEHAAEAEADDPPYAHGSPVVPRVVDVDGIPLSALVCEAPRPRAVIVALHGGGTTSMYFDCPGHPRLSLLRTGAALGFTVVALDRPGYGASADYAAKVTDTARRVDLGHAAVEELLAGRSRGAGVFLLAHSAGCELAVRMASDERGRELLGLAIGGFGRELDAHAKQVLDRTDEEAGGDVRPARGRRAVLWGPSRLYAPDVYRGAAISSPSPPYETEDRPWRTEYPELAARLRIPVHISLGDHETVWRSGPAALAEIASLFTASPRVSVNEQTESGHNLSLGLAALAYHLKVLSFVEECAVRREQGRTR
ncbi:alpha/beta fold hydrolase [Streptomyces himalayensis]|uniref:alpha/beta fold hydrolase n=1 Tax=Streptomyces himalayensis TaxID=2820085 RepID=UPI0028AECA98|nr:alpha/beta fold hydrolase [Streptomyces himalayensis]